MPDLKPLPINHVERVTSAGHGFALDLTRCDGQHRGIVRGYVRRLIYHVPRWVRSLRIVTELNDGNSSSADVGYSLAYGHATITLYANFFQGRDDERVETFVHELAHLLVAPMIALCDEQVDALTAEGREREARTLRTSIERVEESIVSDSAHISLIELSLRREVEFTHVEFVKVEPVPAAPLGDDEFTPAGAES